MAAVTRRDFLKTAGALGAGAAAGIGFPAVLRAQGGGTVKVGVLHSLSGTMAISEVSLRDVCMMAFEEINAKGGVMGKKIEPVIVDPGLELGPVRGEGQAAPPPGQGRGDLRLLDVGQPEVGAAGVREQQRPALLSRAVRGRGVLEERLLHGRHAQPAAHSRRGVPDVEGGRRLQEVLPAGHRLRLPADGQQDPARVPARQGDSRGLDRGGVHAVQPSGLPDHRRQDQALLHRRQLGGALHHQR